MITYPLSLSYVTNIEQARSALRKILRSDTTAPVLLLAGCRLGNPASGERADDTWIDMITRTGQFDANERVLTRAENALVRQCMTARGFHYPKSTAMPKPGPDRIRGYGLYEAYKGTGESDLSSMERYVGGLNPARQEAFRAALLGSDHDRSAIRVVGLGTVTYPVRGCIADADARIYGGSLTTWARVTFVPQGINRRLSANLVRSPTYATSIRAWSACMADRGHRFRNPEEATESLRTQFRKRGAVEQLRIRELQLADDDAECAREVDLHAAVLAVKRARALRLPPAEQRELRELATAWHAAVQRTETLT